MFKNPSKLGIDDNRSERSCGPYAGMMQESLASLTHTNFTHTHTHTHTHAHYVTGLEILEEKKGIWSCGPLKKKAEEKAPQPSKAKEAGERPCHLKNWQNWTTCLTNLWGSCEFSPTKRSWEDTLQDEPGGGQLVQPWHQSSTDDPVIWEKLNGKGAECPATQPSLAPQNQNNYNKNKTTLASKLERCSQQERCESSAAVSFSP